MKISGLIAAPHTPFNPDYSINLDAVAKQAAHLAANGVSGILVQWILRSSRGLRQGRNSLWDICLLTHLPSITVSRLASFTPMLPMTRTSAMEVRANSLAARQASFDFALQKGRILSRTDRLELPRQRSP